MIGELVNALDKGPLADNTLIVFGVIMGIILVKRKAGRNSLCGRTRRMFP